MADDEVEQGMGADPERTAGWDGTDWLDRLPATAPTEGERSRLQLPETFQPAHFPGAAQKPVFEPALLHYRRAFVAGDPTTTDDVALREWQQGRRTAIGSLLAAISDSRWVSALVLRGSTSLASWFGEAAREPGDLDFVVVPDSWEIDDPRTSEMLAEIVRSAAADLDDRGGPVRIDGSAVTSDRIWTYERVPGQRLSVPWHLNGGTFAGWVQLDFVFGETLPVAAVAIDIETPSGVVRLNSATPELSLVWKLLWLIDDFHPQSKDLYDAVLLAENTSVSYRLVCEVLTQLPEQRSYPLTLQALRNIRTERSDSAAQDVPASDSDAALVERLTTALAPTFVDPATGEPFTLWELTTQWFADSIDRYRPVLTGTDPEPLHRLHRLLAEQSVNEGLRPPAIVIVVSELLGPESTLQEAYRSIVTSPAWASRVAAGDFAAGVLNPWLRSYGREETLEPVFVDVAIPTPEPPAPPKKSFWRRR